FRSQRCLQLCVGPIERAIVRLTPWYERRGDHASYGQHEIELPHRLMTRCRTHTRKMRLDAVEMGRERPSAVLESLADSLSGSLELVLNCAACHAKPTPDLSCAQAIVVQPQHLSQLSHGQLSLGRHSCPPRSWSRGPDARVADPQRLRRPH